MRVINEKTRRRHQRALCKCDSSEPQNAPYTQSGIISETNAIARAKTSVNLVPKCEPADRLNCSQRNKDKSYRGATQPDDIATEQELSIQLELELEWRND